MSRLAVILLEQHAQFERRPLSAIAQERRGGVMLAIDFPTADGRAAQPRLAPYALRTALPLQPGDAALARSARSQRRQRRATRGKGTEQSAGARAGTCAVRAPLRGLFLWYPTRDSVRFPVWTAPTLSLPICTSFMTSASGGTLAPC